VEDFAEQGEGAGAAGPKPEQAGTRNKKLRRDGEACNLSPQQLVERKTLRPPGPPNLPGHLRGIPVLLGIIHLTSLKRHHRQIYCQTGPRSSDFASQTVCSWTIVSPSGSWNHRRAHYDGDPEELDLLIHRHCVNKDRYLFVRSQTLPSAKPFSAYFPNCLSPCTCFFGVCAQRCSTRWRAAPFLALLAPTYYTVTLTAGTARNTTVCRQSLHLLFWRLCS
jgi:hypothetical protein